MQMGNRSICDSFNPSELPIGTGHFDIENLPARAVIRIGRVGRSAWRCTHSAAGHWPGTCSSQF